MQRIVIFVAIVMASSSLQAAELTENDKQYCHYLELDNAYVQFIKVHPRVGVSDELLSIPAWVLDKEHELFQRGHKVWLELVAVGYLPLSQPFNDPDCAYLN